MLMDPYWRARVWSAGYRTQVTLCKTSILPAVLSLWPCQRHLSSELRGGIQFYRAPTPYQGADWKPGGWTLHRIGLDQCVVGLWMGSSTSCGPRVPMSS